MPVAFFTLNRIALLLNLIICSWNTAVSQELPFRQFSAEAGLPSTETYAVFQDSRHRYWVCTDNGISYFNGATFTNYTVEQGLPTNTVFYAFENYRDGTIWIVTYGFGLYYLDESTGRFREPAFNRELVRICNKKFINSCSFDSEGNLWIVYDFHGFLKVSSQGSVTVFPAILSKPNGGFELIRMNHSYMVRNLPGKKSDRTLPYEQFRTGENWIISANISSNYSASKVLRISDSLWVISFSGSLLFVHPGKQVRCVNLPQDILSMAIDREQNLWVGLLKGGLHILQPNDGYCGVNPVKGFEGQSVTSVVQDFYGKIWFTTLNKGLFNLPHSGMRNMFTGNKVTGMFLEDRHVTLICPEGESVHLKGVNLTFTCNHADRNLKEMKRGPDGVLYQCRAVYNQVIPEKLDPARINANAIEFFKDYLVAGGKTFLIQYNYRHRLGRVFHAPSPILKLCKLDEKQLLVGCLNGLYVFNDGIFIPLNSPSWIRQSKINGITIRNQRIYILTDGKGLLVYRRHNLKQYQHYLSPLPLSINCMHLGTDSGIWLGGNDGLYKVRLESNNKLRVLARLTTEDGLPSNEINDIQSEGNTLLVASNQGLSVFDFQMKQTGGLYPVYLSHVLGKGKDTLFAGYHRNVHLLLEKGQRDLNFRLASNRSGYPARKVHIQYRIKRNNRIWLDKTELSDPNIQITNLDPGNYLLEITTSDPVSGAVYLSTARFDVLPYFYEQTGFKLLALLSVGLLILWIFRLVLKRMHATNALKHKMALAELDSLRNQMNPHFIFNALNAIQYFIFDNNQEKAGRFLSKFSLLIRKSLEFSKLTFISVQSEIQFISDYLEMEKMRFADKFDYSLEIAEDIDLENTFIPPLLMQPLIENSIKHGFRDTKANGLIQIKIWKESRFLLGYSILDNGIGMTKTSGEEEGYKTSLSHSILKERFSLLRATSPQKNQIGMTIQNLYFNQEYGTYIELKLPLQYD